METNKKVEERIALAEARFIEPQIHPRTLPLDVAMWEVGGEPVTAEVAMAADYEPAGEGTVWGRAWDTAWFRFRGEVPESWKGGEVVALLDLSFDLPEGFGREALVWMDGRPLQSVNRNRTDLPLLENAAGGETIDFHIEAAANPRAEWHWGPADHADCPPDERLFRLKTARLALRNDDAFQLLIDFRVCREAMLELPETSMRRARLRRGLDRACRLMDSGCADWIPAAREVLRPLLACRNGDTAHQITAVGHGHIDTAWCWPLRETIRKCARTFSTALAYMKQHPDYRFSCSQPVQYLWMKHHYPSIFQDIKDAVKRGQWEAMGSMWVEPDCSIPSGESLVRQLVHGKQFFQNELGVETRDLWLPDVFGYSAALPQILRKAGVDWFLSQKISWNDTNRFPHHSFQWEGLDGTRIFSHFPPADTYNGQLTAKEITLAGRQFAQQDRASMSLLPFGQGDGGGGPTVGMIERARRWKDFEGMPQVEMGTVREFFERAEAEIEDAPVWSGELYLELHRGTYTSQARNKWMNRRCESLLRDAEMFEALASLLAPGDVLAADPCPERSVWDLPAHGPEKHGNITAMAMDRAWKLLLMNQFHDILPGSSIGWVYEDSRRDHQVVETIATAVRDASIDRLLPQIPTAGVADPVVVFNTLGHARAEVIDLPDGGLARAEVPSCGYAVVSNIDGENPGPDITPVSTRTDGGRICLANGLVEIRIGANGRLESLRDLVAEREVLQGAGNEFHLLRDYPNRWNAWDIEASAMHDYEVVDGACETSLIEDGPLRAAVAVETKFGSSVIRQRIVLRAGSKRVDFETTVDWHERNRMLKAAFPTTIRADRALCEIQYGSVARPVHRNTSWDAARFEVCAHRWVDLSEGGYGVALLNNGRYGHDFLGGTMRLSLLKGSHAPDPGADLGEHRFTYSLLPHEGSAVTAGVSGEAHALNSPLLVRKAASTCQGSATRHSWLALDQPGVVVEALKRAENGRGLILRLSEATGTRRTVKAKLGLPAAIEAETDLLERPLDDAAMVEPGTLELGAFDLRTLRITPANPA